MTTHGSVMGARGWPAWFGCWAALGVGLLAALAVQEARGITLGAAVPDDQVRASDTAIRLVPWVAALLVPAIVALLGWRVAWLVRGCLLLCAVGLGAAAWTFRQVPDAGEWLPYVVGGAALVALLGAVIGPDLDPSPDRVAGMVASLGLLVTGGAGAYLAWRGLDYQQWWANRHLDINTTPMLAALVLGVVMVITALLGRWLPGPRWLAVLLGIVVALVAVLPMLKSVPWMVDLGLLDRHEESETGWSRLPEFSVGVGLLATAVALLRGWWATAGISAVAGCALATALVVRSDLWRLMW